MAELRYNILSKDANFQAYYKLEDVNDSKGSNNLTNNNSVAFSSSKYGLGADSGTANTNKYLRVANALGFNGGAYSIALWVKLNTEITANTYTFCELVDGTTGTTLVIDYNFNGGSPQIEVFRLRAGISAGAVTAIQTLGTSVFHHMVITYDGTTITGYIDGASFGTPATNTGNGSGVSTGFTILDGRNAPNNTTCASAIIDDVGCWNRALTGREVANLYMGNTSGMFGLFR